MVAPRRSDGGLELPCRFPDSPYFSGCGDSGNVCPIPMPPPAELLALTLDLYYYKWSDECILEANVTMTPNE